LKQLLAMVEQNEDLSHLTRVALSQLASLSGNVFPDKAHQLQYLKTFLELLMPHMRKYTTILSSAGASSSLSPSFGDQMIGLSNILVSPMTCVSVRALCVCVSSCVVVCVSSILVVRLPRCVWCRISESRCSISCRPYRLLWVMNVPFSS
jgi:hypothetical protein